MRGEEYNFADVVTKARDRCEGRFTAGAEEAILDNTDWSWEEELQLLKEEVNTVGDQCRKDETKKMLNQIEVSQSIFTALCSVELADNHWFTEQHQKASIRACCPAVEQGVERHVG